MLENRLGDIADLSRWQWQRFDVEAKQYTRDQQEAILAAFTAAGRTWTVGRGRPVAGAGAGGDQQCGSRQAV